jgi:hypothetical protein
MHARTNLPALLAAALALACGDGDGSPLPTGPDPTSTGGLDARVILDTKYGGIAEPERTVIRDAAAWDALWNRLRDAGEIEPVPTPAVDFDARIAIVAILGERDRGGFDIDITAISRSADDLLVGIRLTVPGATCSQPEVRTTPLSIVTVAETSAPVVFDETTFVQDC